MKKVNEHQHINGKQNHDDNEISTYDLLSKLFALFNLTMANK